MSKEETFEDWWENNKIFAKVEGPENRPVNQGKLHNCWSHQKKKIEKVEAERDRLKRDVAYFKKKERFLVDTLEEINPRVYYATLHQLDKWKVHNPYLSPEEVREVFKNMDKDL